MNELKLNKIETFESGVKVAKLDLKLSVESSYTGSIKFKLNATSLAVRVMSDHTVGELQILLNWLSEDSKDDDNLRTNQSEVILFAKKMIKANESLKEIKEL
jgi:hypothetical protein